jgi:hypothetical protein
MTEVVAVREPADIRSRAAAATAPESHGAHQARHRQHHRQHHQQRYEPPAAVQPSGEALPPAAAQPSAPALPSAEAQRSAGPAEAAAALDGPLGPALVKVIQGNPNPQELAAAVSVLLAAARRATPGCQERPDPAHGGVRSKAAVRRDAADTEEAGHSIPAARAAESR